MSEVTLLDLSLLAPEDAEAMQKACPWPINSDYGKRFALGWSKAKAHSLNEFIPVIEAVTAARPGDDDVVEDFLAELNSWESAFPLQAFPEPDLQKAAKVLKANGMTLDAISASNMRHVVSKIAPKARTVITTLSRGGR